MKATKLPSGNWRIRIYVGKDKDGKKKYKSITAATERKALFEAARFSEHLSLRKGPHSGQTVGYCVQAYIDEKEPILSPTTIHVYNMIYQRKKNLSKFYKR